jgi:hypothetical protein
MGHCAVAEWHDALDVEGSKGGHGIGELRQGFHDLLSFEISLIPGSAHGPAGIPHQLGDRGEAIVPGLDPDILEPGLFEKELQRHGGVAVIVMGKLVEFPNQWNRYEYGSVHTENPVNIEQYRLRVRDVLENLRQECRVDAVIGQSDAIGGRDDIHPRRADMDRLIPVHGEVFAVVEELAIWTVASTDVGDPRASG